LHHFEFGLPYLVQPLGLLKLFLISGVTLWDKKSLREDLDSRPQLMTDLKFSSSDSLSSKSSLLNVSASLKASFLGGLVEVGGSAKYLCNTKSSNQQSRVTMHYSETSRFDQLTMTQLGQITYPQVFDQKTATHVVTAVLYGAQAFMVFDCSFTEDQNKQDIEGELNVMVNKFSKFSIEGKGAIKMTDEDNKKAEKITCTFHGDVHLEQNPTTYMEAVEMYKKLPTLLKRNPENAVPIKVWLYPLYLLDTKAARLEREISTRLISNTEDMMEGLTEVERTCNDLSRRTEVNVFNDIKERLCLFQDSFSIYKMVLQQELSRVLPAIRGRGMEEQSLEDILKIHSSSPFNAGSLNQWLGDAKSELNLLKNHIKTLNEINIEDSDGLNAILLDSDIDVVLCLTFTSLKYKDPYLSTLTEFLKSDKFKELDGNKTLLSVTSDRKWFKVPDVIAKMRENLHLFKRFSEANKNEKSIRFIISAISNPSIPGSSIYLYENGKEKGFIKVKMPIRVKKLLLEKIYFYYCYHHQFTLDLNTVNKLLRLSENNRVITNTGTLQQYPDHPDRFDVYPQVLCRESVCGCCYWEIERSGCVYISVSYKSISRKGGGNECVFGGNDQSWSLCCSSSSYSFRHNNIETDLPVESISSRIGVFVDHSAGTLSFYSVSDTMSLIHTVQTTFTQPLYPGFWVYKGSVKLC
uniref:B30.2/SPRY domain-containing protein n=1 Tax=Cyprinus carpio TaxID=7962 RepID=A0A8C1P3Y7_CYPCA